MSSKQINSSKLILHVLVKKCSTTHKWVAQGVEHNVVAQADTIKLLEKRFIATVLGYLHAYSSPAAFSKEVGPAPKEYQEIFRKLQECERSLRIRPFPKKGKTSGEAVFLQAA
jgi:hypothetical protein